MFLQGIREFEVKVQNIATTLLGETVEVKASGIFACSPSEGIVYAGIILDSFADTIFMERLIKDYAVAPSCAPALWALLHELGHIATLEVLEEEDDNLRLVTYLSGDNNRYMSLPAEVAATDWAVGTALELDEQGTLNEYNTLILQAYNELAEGNDVT